MITPHPILQAHTLRAQYSTVSNRWSWSHQNLLEFASCYGKGSPWQGRCTEITKVIHKQGILVIHALNELVLHSMVCMAQRTLLSCVSHTTMHTCLALHNQEARHALSMCTEYCRTDKNPQNKTKTTTQHKRSGVWNVRRPNLKKIISELFWGYFLCIGSRIDTRLFECLPVSRGVWKGCVFQ